MRMSIGAILIGICLVSSALEGCAGLAAFGQTAADRIQVVEGGTSRKYKIIRNLQVTVKKGHPQYAYADSNNVKWELQRQALALGADAVINVSYRDEPMSLFSWGSVNGSGTAIKYIN